MKRYIEELLSKKWQKLSSQTLKNFDGKDLPGVYLLAWTNEKIESSQPKIRDIFYVGMSNAKGGVKGRLKQFLNGIEKNTNHSAGMRFYKEKSNSKPFSGTKHANQFYFVALCLKCNVVKNTRFPADLRIMGTIAKLEYSILAFVKEKTSNEPELNKK